MGNRNGGTGNGNLQGDVKRGMNQGGFKSGNQGVSNGELGGVKRGNSRNMYLGKVRANKSLRRRPFGMSFKA